MILLLPQNEEELEENNFMRKREDLNLNEPKLNLSQNWKHEPKLETHEPKLEAHEPKLEARAKTRSTSQNWEHLTRWPRKCVNSQMNNYRVEEFSVLAKVVPPTGMHHLKQ